MYDENKVILGQSHIVDHTSCSSDNMTSMLLYHAWWLPLTSNGITLE